MGSSPSHEKALTAAIETQDIDAVRILMRDIPPEEVSNIYKSSVPGNINQCTILHYATWQDNPHILAALLDYADDLEIRDSLGWTPLTTAVNRGSKENVKLLLARGAKIDCDSVQGMHLIATAMGFHDIELIQILMDHGAQATTTSDNDVNGDNQNGCYLLHFAVDDGLIDIARLLIQEGKMPINQLNQTGCSPLHLAAEHNYLDILKLFLEKGADVNIKDPYGNTPLAWARETNAEQVINELERHGGIADKEWHGEKLKLKENRLYSKEKQKIHGIDNSQFEVDEPEEGNWVNGKDFNIPDALQRLSLTEQSGL